MAKKSRKIRAEFRKNRTPRARQSDWTKRFRQDGLAEDPAFVERIGKDELTRHRTVLTGHGETEEGPGLEHLLEVDRSVCQPGRVLTVHGLMSTVQAEDGVVFQCATRRLLKTISIEGRHVVAAGDQVWFRRAREGDAGREGIIEAIEPRHGVLSRNVRGRQHVIATNVDQVLIVTSAQQPPLKPNLIDRMLVAAEQGGIRPIICINKVDLVDPAGLEPLVGVYSQMGYSVLRLSATLGRGVSQLRRVLQGRTSAFAGQSGVGKTSLLNALEPGWRLPVAPVSDETDKGRHTTTTARLLPLSFGGYVVDTPGIRQFQLWDVVAEEVVNYFRDLRPYVSNCKYPNCTHTHEADCAIKDAVADGQLDERRYESYCRLREGDMV